MDKDKQARLEAKGWRFGDADEFLGADAGQLEVDETYKTDNVEALVAENARLKAEVAAANKGAKTNALVNESLANKLKIAVEANRYALATFRALNSYTFEDSDHGLLIAEAVKKLEAFHDEGWEQR